MRRGQMQLFEYVIGTFFIVLILIVVIFMLSSYQTGQLEIEKQKYRDMKTMSMLKRFLSSPMLAKDDSVLDDTKLIAALGMCKELEAFFGKKWYAVVRVLDGKDEKRCEDGQYDTECNYWIFCWENVDIKHSGYAAPVNVARKMGWVMRRGTSSKAEPAMVEVGIYEE